MLFTYALGPSAFTPIRPLPVCIQGAGNVQNALCSSAVCLVKGWGWSTDEEADPARAVMPLSAGLPLPHPNTPSPFPPSPTPSSSSCQPDTLLCTAFVVSPSLDGSLHYCAITHLVAFLTVCNEVIAADVPLHLVASIVYRDTLA